MLISEIVAGILCCVSKAWNYKSESACAVISTDL